MECTWNPRNPFRITLSNGNRTAANTQAGLWNAIMGSHPKSATYAGGLIFQVTVEAAAGNIMIGVASKGGSCHNTHQASGAGVLYYSAGNVWISNSYSGAMPTFNNGDRITVVLKNGRVYFATNGTYINGGNPDTETGYLNSTALTGEWVPCILYYDSPATCTLHCGSTITGTIPTGVKRWDQTVDASVTLVDPDGEPIASQAVKWAAFPAATPDGIVEADAAGSGTTNGEGVLGIAYLGTTLEDGDTGSLLISTTGGVAGEQCSSFYAPVVVSVA